MSRFDVGPEHGVVGRLNFELSREEYRMSGTCGVLVKRKKIMAAWTDAVSFGFDFGSNRKLGRVVDIEFEEKGDVRATGGTWLSGFPDLVSRRFMSRGASFLPRKILNLDVSDDVPYVWHSRDPEETLKGYCFWMPYGEVRQARKVGKARLGRPQIIEGWEHKGLERFVEMDYDYADENFHRGFDSLAKYLIDLAGLKINLKEV